MQNAASRDYVPSEAVIKLFERADELHVLATVEDEPHALFFCLYTEVTAEALMAEEREAYLTNESIE